MHIQAFGSPSHVRGIYLTKHSLWRCLKLSHLDTGRLPGLQFSLLYLQKRRLTLRCLKWHWSPLFRHLNAVSAFYIHMLHGCPSQYVAVSSNRLGMNLPKHLLLPLFYLCKEMPCDKGRAGFPDQNVRLWGLNSWSESGRLGLNRHLPHPQEVP